MKVEINLPSERWFKGEWLIRPKEDSFCVLITSDKGTYLGQYFDKDTFEIGCGIIVKMKDVEWWQPIDLPAEFERAMKEGE